MTQATSIAVRAPLTIRRRPGRRTVVTPARAGGGALPTRADPALVKSLARAFRYQRPLDAGRYASISEMATAERIERGYLGGLPRLPLLAPDPVAAVLDGRQPDGLGLPRLMEPFPAGWAGQRALAPPGRPPDARPRRCHRRGWPPALRSAHENRVRSPMQFSAGR